MKDHPIFKEFDRIHNKLDKLHKVLMEKPDLISQKKIITNSECMELLNVSSGTLANWRKQGKIPYRQTDNKIYYITDELINMLGKYKNPQKSA